MEKNFLPLLTDEKAEQVSTIGQQDWVVIKANEIYKFPVIKGPGYISLLTIASMLGNGNGIPNWIHEMLKKRKLLGQLLYRDVNYLKKLRLKIFFDDFKSPKVDVPFADFFGAGLGKYVQYDSLYLGMTSGSFYCRFPMMFKKECVVQLENLGDDDLVLYGEISYHKVDRLPDDWSYFRSDHNNKKAVNREPITILDIEGRGHYVGCSVAIKGESTSKSLTFLEGDVRMYIDAGQQPDIEYTGTEDYFMGGWYFIKGCFSTPDHGCLVKDWWGRRIQAYRFHTDKIPFSEKIKITLDHGEKNEVLGEYSTVAYWYQK
ncbi:MAG: glycoside hydrolase family 172 protein [Patescibacteria group bacterium]